MELESYLGYTSILIYLLPQITLGIMMFDQIIHQPEILGDM